MTQFAYQDAGNSEAQQMLALSFLLQQDSPGLAKDGVLTGLAVAQTSTASSSVVITRGAGVAQDSVLGGAAMLCLDTNLALNVLGPNPVGSLPRNDLIVFDMATLAAGTGGLKAIIGTGNASPTDPAVPATAIALARVRQIASGQPGYGTIPASRIDDLRVPTSLFSRTVQWGGYPSIPASNASSASMDVIFPAGLFTDQPVVQVSRSGQAYDVTYSSVDATKFTATATRKDGGNVTGNVSFAWTATQFLAL